MLFTDNSVIDLTSHFTKYEISVDLEVDDNSSQISSTTICNTFKSSIQNTKIKLPQQEETSHHSKRLNSLQKCIILSLLFIYLFNNMQILVVCSERTTLIGNENQEMFWQFNTTQTEDYNFVDLLDINVNRMQVRDFLTSYLYPVHQPYMPHPISFDSNIIDLCDDSQVETDNYNKPLNVTFSNIDCIEYFCGENSSNFSLSTKIERFTFSRMINHCLFCMSDKAERFREFITNQNRTVLDQNDVLTWRQTIQSENCPQFPEYYSIKSRLVRHCNSQDSISNNITNSLAVGIINEYYFEYSSYYGQRIKEKISNLNRKLTAFEVLNVTTLKEQGILYNPIVCYCYHGNYYGFQCDAYSVFFSPLCNNWFPLFLAIIYATLTPIIMVTICIPQLHHKINVIKKKVLTIEGKWKRARSIIAGVFNIKLQGAYFLVAGSIFILIENLHDLLSNFHGYRPFHQNFINGIFRAIAVASLCCCFVSMVVNWSHIVNATMNHKPEAKSRLGLKHKITLSIFYGILILCILVMIIVYAATLVNVYAFIVLGISGILYSLFVLFGFLFYGLRIFHSLRKTQDISFSSLRITKFMLAVDFYFVIVMIVSAWVVMGYITGWDNVGLFLGEYRNVELDLVFLILISLLNYMLYHAEQFAQLYGGKTLGEWIKKISCLICELRDDRWESSDSMKKKGGASTSTAVGGEVAAASNVDQQV